MLKKCWKNFDGQKFVKQPKIFLKSRYLVKKLILAIPQFRWWLRRQHHLVALTNRPASLAQNVVIHHMDLNAEHARQIIPVMDIVAWKLLVHIILVLKESDAMISRIDIGKNRIDELDNKYLLAMKILWHYFLWYADNFS